MKTSVSWWVRLCVAASISTAGARAQQPAPAASAGTGPIVSHTVEDAGNVVPAAAPKVDNAALIPKLLPDDRVTMEGMSPDWVKTLIMAEFRIETATPAGTFEAATPVLDHYAEMGVNGLWICPIWERGSKKNGYANFGCGSVEPRLSATRDAEDPEAGVKRFVAEAHRRNIRVIFDIIVWGTLADSPLVKAHPEFYEHPAGGYRKVYGGYAFDWHSAALQTWVRDNAVRFIEHTEADGYRVDLAPDTSGYFFKTVRDALYAKGRKIIVVSEIQNERRDTFDFEETGVDGWTEKADYAHPAHFQSQREKFGSHNGALLRTNLVDAVKSGRGIGDAALQQQGKGGEFRFYTDNLLTHDDTKPFVEGNRVRFGYPAIFAPFIPLWWIGEEWNNPHVAITGDQNTGVMYFNQIDLDLCRRGPTQQFYEDAKMYIRIRRSYPDVFQQFPSSTRSANIVKVESQKNGQPNNLQAYARLGNDRAILVVPNYQDPGSAATMAIHIPYEAMGFSPLGLCTIQNLLTGRVVYHGNAANASVLTARIAAEHLGIYLLEKQ